MGLVSGVGFVEVEDGAGDLGPGREFRGGPLGGGGGDSGLEELGGVGWGLGKGLGLGLVEVGEELEFSGVGLAGEGMEEGVFEACLGGGFCVEEDF